MIEILIIWMIKNDEIKTLNAKRQCYNVMIDNMNTKIVVNSKQYLLW